MTILQEKSELSKNLGKDCKLNFPLFFHRIFLHGIYKVTGKCNTGWHINEWCMRLQAYPKTATISARLHLKTTVLLGYLAWRLYRCDIDRLYNEWNFMAYIEDLAGHHLRDLKLYIENTPEYFDDCQNLTSAETILHYRKNGHEFICEPLGILSFKRGLHPSGIICDDILRDPEVRLDISQLKKVEEIFREQVLSMPTEELHVAGTPQDKDDLFSWLSNNRVFNTKWYPASISDPLWPEEWPSNRLKEKFDEIGEKAFNKEYLCKPVRSEEGYFSYDEINNVIYKRLKNYGYKIKGNIKGRCFGGLDIGKKQHPSHISIFCEGRREKLMQIASIWLDRQDYTKQLEICRWLCENYRMQKFYYDDTRAELEGFKERGELPVQMKGLAFTQKEKFEIAAIFESRVRNKNIALLNDDRQTRQILNVDNDLKCVASAEGHGDCFWSIALALKAAQKHRIDIKLI